MTVNDLQSCIDFFLNCVLNVWNAVRTYGGILFFIMVAFVLYPILRRILRAVRGNK